MSMSVRGGMLKPRRLLYGSTLLGMMLLLGACAGAPGIPETTYFRMPPAADIERLPAPLVTQPIVIDTFYADGLYSDQAILYTLDPQGARVRSYHYQLWIDPPVRLLQRRLIETLRAAGVARIVADRLPTEIDALRVEGRITRLERVQTGAGWHAAVGLSLRADTRGDGKPPLVLKDYVLELPVEGDKVRDSVDVIAAAVDRIYADFVRDLAAGAARE